VFGKDVDLPTQAPLPTLHPLAATDSVISNHSLARIPIPVSAEVSATSPASAPITIQAKVSPTVPVEVSPTIPADVSAIMREVSPTIPADVSATMREVSPALREVSATMQDMLSRLQDELDSTELRPFVDASTPVALGADGEAMSLLNELLAKLNSAENPF